MLRKRLSVIAGYAFVILAILGVTIFQTVKGISKDLEISPFDVFSRPPQEVTKDGYITFLLLGIGGGNHEGPTLTDSIVVASLDLRTHTLKTTGLPRDIWSEEVKDKINSIYTYALMQNDLSALSYTKRKFESLLGLPIDYAFVLDFKHFVSIIDITKGITVRVPESFVDPWFPIEGKENAECIPYDPDYKCRYQTLVFRKGDIHMNGDIALKYIRSRHADGTQGSDFARSKRLQQVLVALSEKIKHSFLSRDIATIRKLLVYLNEAIIRDITNKEVLSLVTYLKNLKIESHTLNDEVFEVGEYARFDGRYVLIPKDGWDTFQKSLIQSLTPQHSSP